MHLTLLLTKKIFSKLALAVLIAIFPVALNTLYSQSMIYIGEGTYNINTSFNESDLHFYLHGDGYHSYTKNHKHQYSLSAVPALVSLFYARPYQEDNPEEILIGTATDGVANPQYSQVEFPNKIAVQRTWNLVNSSENYFVLMFENVESSSPISGCVEFHYHNNHSLVDMENVLDDYNNNWVYSREEGESEYLDFTDKITWSFDGLKFQEQRFVYIPTECLANVFEHVSVRAVMKSIDPCKDVIPFDGKTDGSIDGIFNSSIYTLNSIVSNFPHDPNVIETDVTCLAIQDEKFTIRYKIYFQNEGIDPVQSVFLFFNLNVPYTSIELNAASHTCYLNWDENDVNMTFEDIFLPGCNQEDPPYSYDETYGWVEFTVCFPEDILIEFKNLESKVDIVFDTQNAVTAYNILVNGSSLCEDEQNIVDTCPHTLPFQEYLVNSHANKPFNAENTSLGATINLYPNPSSNFIAIDGLKSNEKYNLTILNASYDVVLQKQSYISSGNDFINIKDFQFGLYILSISNGKDINSFYFIKSKD